MAKNGFFNSSKAMKTLVWPEGTFCIRSREDQFGVVFMKSPLTIITRSLSLKRTVNFQRNYPFEKERQLEGSHS